MLWAPRHPATDPDLRWNPWQGYASIVKRVIRAFREEPVMLQYLVASAIYRDGLGAEFSIAVVLGRLDRLLADRALGRDRAGDIGGEHEGEDHGVEGRQPRVPQREGGDGPAQRAPVHIRGGGRRGGSGVRGDGHAQSLRRSGREWTHSS